MIFVIQFADEQNEIILEMLKNMFVVYGVDYLIDVDDKKMVLIKNVRGIDVENDQFARRIIDNLQMEAMCNAWVGYTDAAEDFVLHLRSEWCFLMMNGCFITGDLDWDV